MWTAYGAGIRTFAILKPLLAEAATGSDTSQAAWQVVRVHSQRQDLPHRYRRLLMGRQHT
jgi:hypothetical protein|eukprot:COSAG03_NODE_178_length_11063_cov_43.316951_14_plen_60_part_00